jgi:hypothetical protein
MKPDNRIDPGHNEKRGILRVLGVAILIIGLVFEIIGLASFFLSFGHGGFPRLFWCCFIGLPLIWLGFVLCGVSFLGAVARFMAGESAPVAKDTFNYMADETKEGVKTVASAVGEGMAAGAAAARPKIKSCPACQATNDAEARFCNQCGKALP